MSFSSDLTWRSFIYPLGKIYSLLTGAGIAGGSSGLPKFVIQMQQEHPGAPAGRGRAASSLSDPTEQSPVEGVTLMESCLDLPTSVVVHTFLDLQLPSRYLLAHMDTHACMNFPPTFLGRTSLPLQKQESSNLQS